MAGYDIFNGDADGICALHQLRLNKPSNRTLITGVKRDIKLLDKVKFKKDDLISVFDISIDSNQEALKKGLERGAYFEWFDHHSSETVPNHPNLQCYLTSETGVCSSLMVDKFLNGRFRSWALVACYGDNFAAKAVILGTEMGLSKKQLASLQMLGELMNYNSYGDSIDDLYVAPEDLYRQIQKYDQPLEFLASEKKLISDLHDQMNDDFKKGWDLPEERLQNVVIKRLPNQKWARRISGLLANRLSQRTQQFAHLILIEKESHFSASIRKPLHHNTPASLIAKQFPTGGGRREAAGINVLPKQQIDSLIKKMILCYK